jgi:galactokinase
MTSPAVQLMDRGMTPREASAKEGLFRLAEKGLRYLGVKSHVSPARFWVPGRIEILGKHTDYSGGSSLVCAVERGFAVAAVPRGDRAVRLFDAGSAVRAEFTMSATLSPQHGSWAAYPMTVARRIARDFGRTGGAEISFASDLPAAAGLSSSSALIVATYLALASILRLEELEAYCFNIRSAEDLAGYLGTVENGQGFGTLGGDLGVGTFGGSEDHTAILCCRAGHASQYRFCPVRLERLVAIPPDMVFVIGASGVAARKTGDAMASYNRASRTSSAVLELWREASGRADASLASALESGADAYADIRSVIERASRTEFLRAMLLDRLEHFREERMMVTSGAEALASGDLQRFGVIADRSQDIAERLLGNQIPETTALARSARELGAAAASAFGAGFGGSVWALVRRDESEEFAERWSGIYSRLFPTRSAQHYFASPPGPAAQSL